jgi:beta-glucosidase
VVIGAARLQHTTDTHKTLCSSASASSGALNLETAVMVIPFPVALFVLALSLTAPVAFADGHAWDDRSLPPSERAQLALDQMTQAEKRSLVHGGLGAPWGHEPKPDGAIGSAGYVPGIPRLRIPPLQETDAELGIANPGYMAQPQARR